METKKDKAQTSSKLYNSHKLNIQIQLKLETFPNSEQKAKSVEVIYSSWGKSCLKATDKLKAWFRSVVQCSH